MFISIPDYVLVMIIQRTTQTFLTVMGFVFIIMFLGVAIPAALATSVDNAIEFIFFKKSPIEGWDVSVSFFEIEIAIVAMIGLITAPFHFGGKIEVEGNKVSYHKFLSAPQIVDITKIKEVKYEKNFIMAERFAAVNYCLVVECGNEKLIIEGISSFPEFKINGFLDHLKNKNSNIDFKNCDKIYSKKFRDHLPDL